MLINCLRIPSLLIVAALISVISVGSSSYAVVAQDCNECNVAGSGIAGCDSCFDSTEIATAIGSCCAEAARGQVNCGCCRATGLWDNLSLFAGLNGAKQPQDFGVNANFGRRFHANWGIPVSEANGLGLQIGAAINETRNATQVFERVEGSKSRTQIFTTLGLFQRFSSGWSWAVSYDYLQQDSFDDFDLGQWRGYLGRWINDCTEVGIRGTLSEVRDRGRFTTIPVVLDPITQGTIYVRRIWASGAATSFWFGLAEGQSQTNLALGDLRPTDERFVYGTDIHCPLNDRLAIFGEANFIQPADTGTVDAYLGIVYYRGGTRGALKRRFAPVLRVADNTSFATDLSR